METMEPANQVPAQPRAPKGGLIGGLVLIALGGIFLLQNYFPQIDFSRQWPIILIVVGAGLLWNNFRGQH